MVPFTASSPDDLENQIEDYIQKGGSNEWAKFLEQTNAESKLALLDGNPRATTALAASSAFRRFGLDLSRTRLGYQSAEVTRWGAFQLRAEAGGGVVLVDRFDHLYTTDGDAHAGRPLRQARGALDDADGPVAQLPDGGFLRRRDRAGPADFDLAPRARIAASTGRSRPSCRAPRGFRSISRPAVC